MTDNRKTVTEQRDKTERDTVTVSRAPADPTGVVTLSRCVTQAHRDVTVGRDSDGAPLRSDTVTVTPSALAVRNQEHRQRLSEDPRFAAWAAGHDEERAARRAAERTELMRRAALAAIQRAEAGQDVDADHLTWARTFVAANAPLQGALGDGAC